MQTLEWGLGQADDGAAGRAPAPVPMATVVRTCKKRLREMVPCVSQGGFSGRVGHIFAERRLRRAIFFASGGACGGREFTVNQRLRRWIQHCRRRGDPFRLEKGREPGLRGNDGEVGTV